MTNAINMRCLLVRQPYATLISLGFKQIEFRNRPLKYRGPVLIAASRGLPLKTNNETFNKIAMKFPRGKLLAKVIIEKDEYINNQLLKKYYNGSDEFEIYGEHIDLANNPLGEPIEDIIDAINDSTWSSYAWYLKDVSPFKSPIDLSSRGYGPWLKLNKSDLSKILNDS